MKINIDKIILRYLITGYRYSYYKGYLFDIIFESNIFIIYTTCTDLETSLGSFIVVDDHYELQYRTKVLNLIEGDFNKDLRVMAIIRRSKLVTVRLIYYLSDRDLCM